MSSARRRLRSKEFVQMQPNGMDEDETLDKAIYESTMKRSKPKKTRKMDSKTVRTIRGPMYDIRDTTEQSHNLKTATIHDITDFTSDTSWQKMSDVQALRIEDEEQHLSDFPAQVWSLERLENLTLTLSKTTLLSKKSVRGMQKMNRLAQLFLPENCLRSVEGVETIGGLTVLDLRRNELTCLPEAIGNLSYLSHFYVAGNKLPALPDSIGKLGELEEFDCRSNCLESLPDSIGKLQKLKFLDVGQNLLLKLPDAIGKLVRLKQLQADSNKLCTMPANLSQLTLLHHVYLSKNLFAEVPESLGGLEALGYLNMSQNRIQTMPPVFYTVQTLILDNNHLEVFPDTIHQCRRLQILSLQSNRLYTIPASIGKLKELRHLYLGGNQIAELPECISELVELRHLTLNATKVQTLPSDFPKLRRLSLLDISDTNMDPSIHSAYMESGIDGVKRCLSQRGGKEAGNRLSIA